MGICSQIRLRPRAIQTFRVLGVSFYCRTRRPAGGALRSTETSCPTSELGRGGSDLHAAERASQVGVGRQALGVVEVQYAALGGAADPLAAVLAAALDERLVLAANPARILALLEPALQLLQDRQPARLLLLWDLFRIVDGVGASAGRVLEREQRCVADFFDQR